MMDSARPRLASWSAAHLFLDGVAAQEAIDAAGRLPALEPPLPAVLRNPRLTCWPDLGSFCGMRRARMWPVLLLSSAASVPYTSQVAEAEEQAGAAMAEGLFREGRGAMGEARTSQACQEFSESQRLNPATGTVLNLALCHEMEGKLASAFAEFGDARERARREGRSDVEDVAMEHLANLEPQLSKLHLEIPTGAAVVGLRVERDGTLVPESLWGRDIPIDAGEHTVRASAPGRKSFLTILSVQSHGDVSQVTIPVLDAAQPSASTEAALISAEAHRLCADDEFFCSGAGAQPTAWLGARAGVLLPTGNAWPRVQPFNYTAAGWGDYASAGPMLEVDAGVRIYRDLYILALWERAEFGAGSAKTDLQDSRIGNQTRGDSDFWAVGMRLAKRPRVGSASLAVELSYGYRRATSRWEDGTELKFAGWVEGRFCIGALFQLSQSFALSPMLTVGAGVFNSVHRVSPDGTSVPVPDPSDYTSSVPGQLYVHGNVGVEVGGHFDFPHRDRSVASR